MKLTNRTYDLLKWGVTIFLPALMTFVSGLGIVLNIENTEVIVAVIGLITTFLGSLIGISTKNYNNEKE